MRNALVSVHGLKNELYSFMCSACEARLFRFIHARRACFGSWIKERVIFMCSALVSVNALKN